jgi:glycosyltransferase involved in cell wall biosynthesis
MHVPSKKLLILGVYPESEGYPNIKYRLEDLANVDCLVVEKIHGPIWQATISNQKRTHFLKTGFRFVWAHLTVVSQYLQQSNKDRVYIPYPAVFISFLLSLLPKRYQPKRLVLDAFISLYDTLCIDRAYIAPRHILGRLLYRIEQRAYRNCTYVVVDTEQNKQYLSRLFAVANEHFVAMPLSTNEQGLLLPTYVAPAPPKKYQILFIGTLVPLQGIDVILGAIELLLPQNNLVFKIICNGQLAPPITAIIEANPGNVIWIKAWQSQAQLLDAIQEADICLGIFGTTAKTQRVCPLKIYSYAAGGRAIITAETDWMRTNTCNQKEPPFILIPGGSAEALATAIGDVVSRPEQISRYAQAAREFYVQSLANKQGLKQLLPLFYDD